MRYSDELLNYFHHLDHAGIFKIETAVLHSSFGSEEQGDLIEFSLVVDTGIIRQAKFQCFGGVASLAACEFICRWLEGKSQQDLQQLTADIILRELKLSSLQNPVAVRIIECLKQLREKS